MVARGYATRFPEKLPHLLALTRLNRPIGILLLLWPMLWALWFAAAGVPDIDVLLIFVTGVVLTRSAGCAINDYADRDFDAHVSRTATRPLATGVLSASDALKTAAALMLLAFLLVLMTNALTIALSFAALLLAASYPFAKRVTDFPQVVLGLAFAFAVPMAYTAQTGAIDGIGWTLFLAAVLWAVAYDTLYAMTDREDDLKIGIRSTAIRFGRYDLTLVAIAHAATLLLLAFAGVATDRGAIFHIGLLVAGGFAIHQLWIARQRDPTACFRAFLNNNWLGLVIFVALVVDFATTS